MRGSDFLPPASPGEGEPQLRPGFLGLSICHSSHMGRGGVWLLPGERADE